jgi:hypothetical protein
MKSVVHTEWDALTEPLQNAWRSLLQLELIPIGNANIRNLISHIWGAGTTTRSNIVALQSKTATRGEVLWGEGVNVTQSDVQRARM